MSPCWLRLPARPASMYCNSLCTGTTKTSLHHASDCTRVAQTIMPCLSPSPLASTTPHLITQPPNNKYQAASHGRSAQNFHLRESERLPFVSITLIRPANSRIHCHYSAGARPFATTARFSCTRTHCGRASMRRTALTAAATSQESVGSSRKRRLADRPAVGSEHRLVTVAAVNSASVRGNGASRCEVT